MDRTVVITLHVPVNKIPQEWDELDTKTQKRFMKVWIDKYLHSFLSINTSPKHDYYESHDSVGPLGEDGSNYK